ncbi:YheC/YheD family protein [Neobacillus terrae]|uniref:YheC/YheD family protein n=1 Tax=Neobacillus terrae TaxID=3034837 RepID=UPI00140E8C3E|nr:YheC/YheD family protein [Neobacillus terrae]NHM31114.1 hypothetical protein [Neobacillus terrae]
MRASSSKWKKHKLMMGNTNLQAYLPKTILLSNRSLIEWVENYTKVMLKPCFGSQGKGVIQITSFPNKDFEVHHEYQRTIIKGKEQLYDYLKENYYRRRNTKYIIQEKIPLASIQENPFDIRVMVQRKINTSEWTVTAKCAKVAANNYVITNVAKAILPVDQALEESCLSNFSLANIDTKLNEISLTIVEHLSYFYPKTRAFGIDLGIDEKGEIWIIEVNLRPSIFMFKSLKDGSFSIIKSFL